MKASTGDAAALDFMEISSIGDMGILDVRRRGTAASQLRTGEPRPM
ncbi:MAG: hypothetical protein ACREPQ_05140 [Rhodanobacter sp.]